MTSLLRIGLPLLVFALLFSSAWWLQRARLPVGEPVQVSAECALHQAGCGFSFPDGPAGSARFGQLPVKLLNSNEFFADLPADAQAAWVDLSGVNMDMGTTRAELVRQPDGLWKGQLVLPICTNTVMTWQATLWVERKARFYRVPLSFETRR